MGMKAWLKNLLDGGQSGQNSVNASSKTVGTTGNTEPEDAVIGGLDFVQAITAHQQWKNRLQQYLEGTSTETLSYQVVCRDDQCVLGKWINGMGREAYGHLPVFSELKMTHAQFHLSAGNIIRLIDSNKLDEAKEALHHGEYVQRSVKTQGLLANLHTTIAD